MFTTDYATLIFGGVAEVKWLLVEELKMAREGFGISAEELDAIFNFGDECPKIAEIEADPNLLTKSFLQKIRDGVGDRHEDYEEIVDVIGQGMMQVVKVFLAENPAISELALKEFKQHVKIIDITFYSKNSKGKVVAKAGYENSLPPIFYAETHVLTSIMLQLDSI